VRRRTFWTAAEDGAERAPANDDDAAARPEDLHEPGAQKCKQPSEKLKARQRAQRRGRPLVRALRNV
jgi:hypothetical protein